MTDFILEARARALVNAILAAPTTIQADNIAIAALTAVQNKILTKCIQCNVNFAVEGHKFCSIDCTETWFITRLQGLERVEAILDKLLDEDIKDADDTRVRE